MYNSNPKMEKAQMAIFAKIKALLLATKHIHMEYCF